MSSIIYFAFGAAVVSGTLYYLLRKYIAGGFCRSRASLKGRTVIVTGANVGIGLETAADLAGRGARVIMACRSVERGEKAAVEVRKRSANNDVVFSQLDLASFESVRQFAERTLKEESHIDVLVNNAGVCLSKVSRTIDGNEIHFATNHLGHFLLTNLLLHRIKESTAPRIVVVSSRVHHYHEPFDFETVNTNDNTLLLRLITRAYAQSKLANALFSYSLSKRLEGTGVTVNALHPGFIATEMSGGGLFFRGIPLLSYIKVLVLSLPPSLLTVTLVHKYRLVYYSSYLNVIFWSDFCDRSPRYT